MNGGKGYSYAFVYECLKGTRNNAAICALHDEVAALTKASKASKRTAQRA